MQTEPDGQPLRSRTGDVTLELLAGVRAGQRAQLEALCERVGPAVLAWAHLRMRPSMRARVDPQEVVQEVWLRVLANLGERGPEPKLFRSWVFGIARNVMFELSRKASFRPAGRQAEERWESFLGAQADEATGVSVYAARQDLLQDFLERVAAYGETERRLLVLHGLEGRNFPEVAEKLGLSRDVVAKRWQRLRARLEEEGIPEYLLL